MIPNSLFIDSGCTFPILAKRIDGTVEYRPYAVNCMKGIKCKQSVDLFHTKPCTILPNSELTASSLHFRGPQPAIRNGQSGRISESDTGKVGTGFTVLSYSPCRGVVRNGGDKARQGPGVKGSPRPKWFRVWRPETLNLALSLCEQCQRRRLRLVSVTLSGSGNGPARPGRRRPWHSKPWPTTWSSRGIKALQFVVVFSCPQSKSRQYLL